jgi:putative flippase GtrA
VLKDVVFRLARSAGAGGVATLADLGTLTLLVSGLGVAARNASVPALIVGNVVMFFGQRLAFRPTRREEVPACYTHAGKSAGGDVRRQIALFAVVQLVGLGLNALAYDLALRALPLAERWYVATRLATTNLVWLGYSFPLWHLVFRARPTTP